MRVRTLSITLCIIFTVHLASAQKDAAFELAFCGQVASYPMADRDRGGFDIEIAKILADELGANPTFTWTRFDDVGIRESLHSGICDAAIGVGEGVANMITTVPYLNAGYVFVTRVADGITIESLDDPQLRDLRIGTYQSAVPTVALRNRGITANVTEYAANISPNGVDPHTPILNALVTGEVDVAITYGPYAAARASEENGRLALALVTPEIDLGPSLLQLSRILTIGVRPHDEALRDGLNRALARRWDDISAVLDAYGVARFPVSQPINTGELANATRVGVIFPATTPASLANAPVGDNALLGVSVAKSAVQMLGATDAPFLVLNANAPTLESIARAARRFVAVDNVQALVGGYSPDAALILATIAAELNVPFFNVGSEVDALRSVACYPTTFHIAPSSAMMIEASLNMSDSGPGRVFAVVEKGEYAEDLTAYVSEVLRAAGGSLAGSATVEPNQFVYYPLLEEIAAFGATTVLLLMNSDAQEVFMGQAASLLPTARLLGVSPVRGQSRPYLERFRQATPGVPTSPRVVAWDPAVDAQINETFSSRTGEPMEPAAWTTYAAIVVAFEAVKARALGSADALGEFLHGAATVLDLGDSEPATFREDGQLLRELYVIESAPGAAWGRSATSRTALAAVTHVVPTSVTSAAVLPLPTSCGAL